MGERVGQIAKVPEVKQSNSNSRVRRTERLQSMDTPVDRILFLQRTAGNQAVSRLMRSGALQAKLSIGQPGDVYEQEADRVADAVMRMPEPGVQRQVDEEAEEELLQTKPLVVQITPLVQRQVEEEEMLQAKTGEDATSEVTNDLESRINAIKGGGQPLAESERAFFEPRFGVDFSQVRLHTDTRAAESARAVNARAYTVGRDVVFGAGQYAPRTGNGQKLMAHELTHGNRYVQRVVAGIQAKLTVGQPEDKYKQEAARVADAVMCMPEPEVQRQVEPEEEEEELLQTKEISGQNAETTPDLESRINAIRGGGQPLPESDRSFFEPRFGTDFSEVRMHVDTKAAELARAVNARAFTMGQDVVFGNGEYAPETGEGKRLLGHELTHVVQQRGTTSQLGLSSVIQLQITHCDNSRVTRVNPPRNPSQEIIDAHTRAVLYSRATIRQLLLFRNGEVVEDRIRWGLDRHFRIRSPDHPQLQPIIDRFDEIITRLNRGAQSIYRCSRVGCNLPGPDALAHQVCHAVRMPTRICPTFFDVDSLAQRVSTLIHEAAHAVGACGDVYIHNSSYPGPSPFSNAEPYGEFAAVVGLHRGL